MTANILASVVKSIFKVNTVSVTAYRNILGSVEDAHAMGKGHFYHMVEMFTYSPEKGMKPIPYKEWIDYRGYTRRAFSYPDEGIVIVVEESGDSNNCKRIATIFI